MFLPERPPPTGGVPVKKLIREVIEDAIVPSWFQKPPARFGEEGVGTIKASEWRNLFALHIPLALMSAWDPESVRCIAGANDTERREKYDRILEVTMHLVCALTLMGKRRQSSKRSESYRVHLARWYQGIQEIWNEVGTKPNVHAAFHIWDFIQLFGPAVFWWCFGFERLIGHLEKLPHNHTKRKSGFVS